MKIMHGPNSMASIYQGYFFTPQYLILEKETNAEPSPEII
jgi:hypothetical protein